MPDSDSVLLLFIGNSAFDLEMNGSQIAVEKFKLKMDSFINFLYE